MPITAKRKANNDQPITNASDDSKPETFTRFVYRPNWFVLSQTDGQAVEPMPIPEWDQARALEALCIIEEPFSMTDGNWRYRRYREVPEGGAPQLRFASEMPYGLSATTL